MFKTLIARLKLVALLGLPGALLTFTAFTAGCSKQVELVDVQEKEAQLLYDRADLYVRKIGEGEYTYDYINFHYNQALKNVDRILLGYPDTAVGQKLQRGELKLGKFTIDHFRNAVLAQLGDMKEATESFVNCAIYLHNLPEADRAESREALGRILETLCIMVRSDEAQIFPTLPEDRIFARETIIRTVSGHLQDSASLSLIQSSDESEQPLYAGAYLEGLTTIGLKMENVEDLIESFKSPTRLPELGALRGMIARESLIYRDQYDKNKKELERASRQAAKDAGKEPEAPKAAPVRYDIAAFYAAKFGADPLPAAISALASFKALQGQIDEARSLVAKLDEDAKVAVIGAYYEHLGLVGQLTGQEDLHRKFGLSAEGVARGQLKLVEYLAQNAKYAAADALQASGTAEFPKFHDKYIRARWRGRFYSREELFYLDAKTIPNLDIKDPAVCAQVLLDWVLAPNRLQRVPSWGGDAIIFKYFSMQREDRPTSRQLLNKDKKAGS